MTIYIAVIGVGLVGSEFLTQLFSLPKSVAIPGQSFKLVYVSNSKSSAVDIQNGLTPTSYKDLLKTFSSGDSITPNQIHEKVFSSVTQVQSTNSNTAYIIVDNTSSEDIAALYPLWLKAGYNVVTPNKKAFSGNSKLALEIHNAVEESRGKVWVGKEATVGAGLPIIGTVRTLVETGDEITKIEGVLSGTLSYIFNEFSPATPAASPAKFSSIVAIAREKGYTEPHPADDLNGADVARKLTILARSITAPSSTLLPEGYKSVPTQSLIPAALASIQTGDEFIARLPEFDDEFERLRKEAEDEGQVLRYAGVVEVGSDGNVKVEAKLGKYPKTHAFATSLQGSDNIIAFHSKRYSNRPLIVQGAGAGAAVTAMGVLGDVLQVLRENRA